MTHGYGHFLGFIGDWVRFARRDDLAYRALGVSEAADDAEIEQAYLRLMAQYQPERLTGLAGSLRRRAQRKAVEIDTAYARIRAMRRRAESAQSAMARSGDRAVPAALVWLALALVAVVILASIGPMRDLWAPAQAPLPAPQPNPPTALPGTPASPAVAATPAPAAAPPEAEAEAPARVEQLLVLMPSEPAPAQPGPQAPPALSGEAALVEAIRLGQLRPASGSDVSRWAMRWSEVNRRSLPESFQERIRFMSSYVIQKDFTIPEGLNGANAVIFVLDTRVPYPRGNPGHSMVLDLSTGACMGVTCRMTLD